MVTNTINIEPTIFCIIYFKEQRNQNANKNVEENIISDLIEVSKYVWNLPVENSIQIVSMW